MTELLMCAAVVVAFAGGIAETILGIALERLDNGTAKIALTLALALIAAALYLAWRAGGAV